MPESKIHPMSPETAIAVSHKAAELEKALRRVIRGKDDVVAARIGQHLCPRTSAD